MFINDLFKKKLNESLRDGEYYIFKVFFDDGSDETLRFADDDIDWDRVGAKRGKQVVNVKQQGGIQGSQSDDPRKPHDFPDDLGLARSQRAYDRQLPEGGFDIPEIPRSPTPKPPKEKNIAEAHGPYGKIKPGDLEKIQKAKEREKKNAPGQLRKALPPSKQRYRDSSIEYFAKLDEQDVTEGSARDKLHRRHQELRKKSGLPDPDYYKELKASYDIENDQERLARQAEIKKKYQVAEDDDSPAMTPSGVPWQGPKLNREVITPPEGMEWRFGKNSKEDPTDRADARQLGTFVSSVPNPIAKAAGMLMRYAGQDPKEDWRTKFLKATDSAGNPDYIGRYLNKKPMKEQGLAEGSETHKYQVVVKGQERSYSVWVEAKNEEVAIIKAQQYVAQEHNDTAKRAAVVDMKQGVAEGISVVDSNYDLDQLVLTLDIEGQRKHFTYWDYDENFANAERKDVFAQLQEQPWYAGLDHPTKMEILDAAYKAIRGEEPSEYRPTVGDEPLDEAGPFSYGAKKPRKGSVADLAAKKRREQERGKQPIEPRDQMVGTAKVVTNEDVEQYLEEMRRAGYDIVTEAATMCPECGGPAFENRMLAEKQDACYHKVKSRYKVWPSAYASGALVRCRKKGAKNWGNKSKK